MECIFLNAAGTTLFTRTDMESGHWVQQEMTVTADFSYVPGKVIQRGQMIAFRDPATDVIQVFEIRNVQTSEPDHLQQISAEHIALSELRDEHINKTEINDKTAAQALTTALTGTLWSVGNNTASGTQNADFGRGSVWDAVITIQSNWNVYITPRVVISSAGAITGRYLDISPAQGTWRGVRLSIRKNLLDPIVTYSDEDVLTALYGYGGQVTVENQSDFDTTKELDFASEVWTATSAHPAKPSGQTYLEWPEKTALYGRAGRPRFGYYQNSDITSASVLLQKTWEALQKTCDPKISITGTVVDLYRLGYKDQPLRLHDIAEVEIEETGEVFRKEIITLDLDLIDPAGSRPEIGDYIPNIIYISRDTNEEATTGTAGGRGGGGGGRGQSNKDKIEYDTFAELLKHTDELGSYIGMVVGKKNGNEYIKAGEIALSINSSSGESTALINANHVNISATNTAHLLAGSIVYDENGNLVLKESTGGGVLVEHNNQGTTATFGVWDKGNLTGGVMVEQINGQTGQTITRLKGSLVIIGNDTSIDAAYRGQTLDGTLTAITSDFTSVNTLLAKKIEATDINATTVTAALANATVSNIASLAAGNILINSFSLKGALQNFYFSQPDASGNITVTLVPVEGSNRTFTFNKGDTTAAYNQGWNDCIDNATSVTRYTRDTGVYGGSTTHYILQYGQYTNVGSGWYKTSSANAYLLPAPKQ